MNVEELEAHLIELKSKQMNTRGVLRKLLQIHCRNRNVERALQIKKVTKHIKLLHRNLNCCILALSKS
jgi:ribosomal protein L29